MINIRKLESELWESADLLRSGSKLTSNQYCMPVLGLLFLRYAYSRFKMEISKTEFRKFMVMVPPENMLQTFNDFVKPIIHHMESECKAIQHLTQARDRLLPKLMSGEMAV